MTRTARAAVVTAPNGAINVEEFPIPAIARGQMLLRIELNGICATDSHIYAGEIPWVPYPTVMGHEFVGVIEKMDGPRQDSLGREVNVGDRIVPMAATPCGQCFGCTMKPQGGWQIDGQTVGKPTIAPNLAA